MTVIRRQLDAEAEQPPLEALIQVDKCAIVVENHVSVNLIAENLKQDEKTDLEEWKPVVNGMVTLIAKCNDVAIHAIVSAE